jgi:hypothetical protein
LQIPKASTHPRFAHLPELESFARSDKERRLLEIYRSFSIAGASFITPPRTPPARVRMLRDATGAQWIGLALPAVFADINIAKG